MLGPEDSSSSDRDLYLREDAAIEQVIGQKIATAQNLHI